MQGDTSKADISLLEVVRSLEQLQFAEKAETKRALGRYFRSEEPL